MEINGLEANVLLLTLDRYLGVDKNGCIQSVQPGYNREELQSLRDRLFAAHIHPDDPEELE